jgi:SprT protein
MEKISEKLNELIKKAEILFYPGKFGDITFSMNGRLTSTAGRAFYKEGRLDFSKVLYAQNVETFLNDTVPHELAHIIAYRVYNSSGHDASWKKVMMALGYEPTRCHSYEVQQRSSAKVYKYVCGCEGKTHEVSAQRQAWINKGKTYQCTTCGTRIVRAA